MKLIYEINLDILPWTFMSRHVHDACAQGRTIEIEQMSREGADLNDSDEVGNTPLWLAYIGGHLDTVFALLELNVDINRRTGSILASDFHRACGWADEVFIDILCNYKANLNLTDRMKEISFKIRDFFVLIGYGKTPLIYAIEYRTCLSESNEEDLIRLLINKGADVNHVDLSGLTPLFYAIYRGIPSIVKILLDSNADYKYENFLGYSPFRYALGCLSYSNPNEEDIYFERLSIVEILLEKFQYNKIELKYAIIGYTPNIPYLFPLFDFIFYCRIQNRIDLEEIGWKTYEETHWPCNKTYGNLLIAQNLIVFNQNIEHIIYFLQRMYIENYKQLIIFYLQRVVKDKESINRFFLLLYCAFIEMNGNYYYIQMLKYLLENQRIYLFKQRRDIIKSILGLCQQTPIRLLGLCRQKIRQYIKSSIDQRISFDYLLPKNLQRYLILDELTSFIISPTTKRLLYLIEQNSNSSLIELCS
jgi:ankyrin repeat protein